MPTSNQQIDKILDMRLGRGEYEGKGHLQDVEAKINALEENKGFSGVGDIDRCKGLDELWRLLFEKGEKFIAKHLVMLYAQSGNAALYSSFLSQCINNVGFLGSLRALKLLIRQADENKIKENDYNG